MANASSYSIHDGDRNRLWPRETLIRGYYEGKVLNTSFGLVPKWKSRVRAAELNEGKSQSVCGVD